MTDEERLVTDYCAEIWQVEVHGGTTPIDISGPVRLGSPTVTLGTEAEDMSEVHHNFEYAPVGLTGGGGGSWLVIESNDSEHGRTIHRSMFHVIDVHFSNLGHISVEGLELREDGTAVRALWHIEPYQ